FGVRWIVLGQHNCSDSKRPHFSVGDLFWWTAAAALIAMFFQWAGAPHVGVLSSFLATLAVLVGYPAAATLLAMWAMLTDRGTLRVRVTIAFAAWMALVIALLIAASILDTNPSLTWAFAIVGTAVLTMVWLLAVLHFFRQFDHRLIRTRTIST